ncbi:DHS-like NAD/FAD-binding domain-containing protein [Boeremia exigua]|uniref:DHS-like NAD/FAD-binding domain-containing protein n=1 Tax=Boeremia exigua TaxID=749465 RepID=UPI001E8D41F0|nr:DHS-like NAD/FAD-binding domain-containing protein [Boeremia exigua]KAH6644437.1 DHS-like NAD/FAD-binding domain-containing protein [Boeremia exigua]
MSSSLEIISSSTKADTSTVQRSTLSNTKSRRGPISCRRRQEYRQQAQEDQPRRKDKAEKNRPKNRNRGQAGRVRKMGNEESSMVDPSTRPFTLGARSTEALAQYIEDGKAKKIVVLTGAGISTSAGIPDFRSPETGLYANLERLNLPHPEAVFELSFFRENPLPFYTLAQELYPGKFRPTITHSFITLLHQKGLLLKLFTQNIDCLEREAGVPGDKIIEAHGSFADQACIDCKKSYPKEQMLVHIENKTVPRCIDTTCNGLVKPKIVFFGEQLPREFFENIDLVMTADLCIILGTSLSVHPFASLPDQVNESVPRLLVNMERVGTLGSRPDDVLILKDCDTGVKELADALGWTDELASLWASTAKDGQIVSEKEEPQGTRTRDEQLQDEVDKLTKSIDQTLKLGAAQQKWLDNHIADQPGLEKKPNSQPADSADPRALAPVKKEGGGLAHIFPFLSTDKKSGGSNL